ncbi:hypothetical protein KC19_6G029700 [Ceratodon purpureus]|uniref:Conserved oligomeric Golgi complex subunit 2 n=1 Tax=Ceratodon purpureus TaxID=3225 RepID=A0A8T0HBC0_CERPU|nr:hypothetical protein KC19_6G029700 [Ceratodon purpureus]
MAPAAEANPPSPLPLPMSHRSVVSMFGDDGDSAPLWFKKDAFSSPAFDPEAYISDLRRFVPFETLRAELRGHLGGLKNELVELINRDYTDFVNLSTKLVDVDGAVLRMRMPLNELRGRLVMVRDNVNATLLKLQDGLKRRADMSASREILELLLDTSHVVSKVEKLLLELQSMPEEGPQVPQADKSDGFRRVYSNGNLGEEQGASLEETRSRLLERIASEMNRLKFYVARAQDLPFIQNMKARISSADESLDAALRRCFVGALERRDETVIVHCLRAYAAIDNSAGAEEAFRSAVVAPFVQRIVFSQPSGVAATPRSDRLEEVLEEIKVHVQTDCQFLLDKAAAANSGLLVFDFLSNSILKEVLSSLQKGKPGAFSPGKPTEFLANYKSSLKFLGFLEEYCRSQTAVGAFRTTVAYADFIKQWNLQIYFTLRFQEIAQSLDQALAGPSVAQRGLAKAGENSLGLALSSSCTLWECLQRCWQDDVYIDAISDKFLRLTLQLLARHATWLSVGLAARRAGSATNHLGGEWALASAPEDFVLLRHDVELLVRMIKSSYTEEVLALLNGSAEDVTAVVRESLSMGSQSLLTMVPALSDVLTEALTEKCVEVLKQAKGIIATYRMTNRPLPSRHSPYVTSVFQPLKAFVDDERYAHVTKEMQAELITSVSEKITAQYDVLARDMVSVARQTEASLQLLRRGARQRGAGGADTSDNISDNLSDKICAQLFLDVQEYGRRLAALGVAAADIPAYISLWQCVAPQDRQEVVRYTLS